MWIPKNGSEIERAATAGELVETPIFDAKAALPQPKKNASLAVDVGAMSTEGGVLLYGVTEDEDGNPTIPSPIELAGVGQRIDQIISTSIVEVPFVEVLEFPTDDDPSKGFVAVVVPQSERAPHQIIVGNEFRFYGRGPKGNRILTEGEIARLYQRREEWTQDRDALLQTVIAHSGVPPMEGQAFLHAFTRPIAPDPEMFERAIEDFGGRGSVHQRLLEIVSGTVLSGQYGPSLNEASYWEHRSADEWRFSTRSSEERLAKATRLVELRLNRDGRGQLFCGRATDTHGGSDKPLIIEVVIAGNAEAFFSTMGAVYDAAGYHGRVDIGLAITGLEGVESHVRSQNWTMNELKYSAPTFSRTAGVAAAELRDGAGLAHRLLRHFFEASTGVSDYDAFST